VALSTAIMTGEQSGTNLRGDWIMSGADADFVVGGADSDVLMGGGGSDIVVGGPGDDNIEGDLGWITNTFSWTATRNVGTQPDGSLFHQLVRRPWSSTCPGGADVITRVAVWTGSRRSGDDFVDAGSGTTRYG
jgi:Ca2+-binding RTX toxin-like protein